jgi:hypothetical protein
MPAGGLAERLRLTGALTTRIPHGRAEGLTLGDVIADPETGAAWLGWALRRPAGFWPDTFETALAHACRWFDQWNRS